MSSRSLVPIACTLAVAVALGVSASTSAAPPAAARRPRPRSAIVFMVGSGEASPLACYDAGKRQLAGADRCARLPRIGSGIRILGGGRAALTGRKRQLCDGSSESWKGFTVRAATATATAIAPGHRVELASWPEGAAVLRTPPSTPATIDGAPRAAVLAALAAATKAAEAKQDPRAAVFRQVVRGQFTGDARPDLVVNLRVPRGDHEDGPWCGDHVMCGALYVLDGGVGAPIPLIDADTLWDGMEYDVEALTDLDGDGVDEIVVGWEGLEAAGVHVLRLIGGKLAVVGQVSCGA